MRIEDMLGQKRFKKLDVHLTQEMYRLAGDDLVKKMIDVWKTENDARNWFYSPLQILEGKRPYDYCKNDNISEVENILGEIKSGAY